MVDVGMMAMEVRVKRIQKMMSGLRLMLTVARFAWCQYRSDQETFLRPGTGIAVSDAADVRVRADWRNRDSDLIARTVATKLLLLR